MLVVSVHILWPGSFYVPCARAAVTPVVRSSCSDPGPWRKAHPPQLSRGTGTSSRLPALGGAGRAYQGGVGEGLTSSLADVKIL